MKIPVGQYSRLCGTLQPRKVDEGRWADSGKLRQLVASGKKYSNAKDEHLTAHVTHAFPSTFQVFLP